jgi:acetylornithine/succinyldiaminopimelate/putrescine aminotransferase
LLRLAERRRPKTRGARGRGLLQGLLIDGDPGDIVARARAHGLLLSTAGANVVRLVPPLIVSKAEIDEAVEILDAVLEESR